MGSDCDASKNSPKNVPPPTTAFRPPPPRRRLSFRRRPRLPTVRLGGKKPRRGFFLVRLFRRVRLMRSIKLKYSCMIKKLKDYYRSLLEDVIAGSGTIESFHQRMLMEASFAVPVLGLSFNSFPNNRYASTDRL